MFTLKPPKDMTGIVEGELEAGFAGGGGAGVEVEGAGAGKAEN